MRLRGLPPDGFSASGYLGNPDGVIVGTNKTSSRLVFRQISLFAPPIGKMAAAGLIPMVAERFLAPVAQAFATGLRPKYVSAFAAPFADAVAVGLLPEAVQQKFVAPVGAASAQGVLPSFT